MSERWAVRPLSDVVQLQRGHDLPTPTRRAGAVPVVGSFGITGWHDVAKAHGPGVAIGRSGASIGTATFVADDYWPLNTALYVRDFKGNDPRWTYWLLHSIDFAAYNSGSAQPSLNRNFLTKIPVHLPPLDEQRRIAGVLGALDVLVDTNERFVRQVRELSALAYRRAKRFASTTVRLGDVVQVNSRLTKAMAEGSLTYLDIASVGDGSIDWPDKIGWAEAPSRARRLADPGSTLWSTVRPNRRAHALLVAATDDLVVSTGLAVLTPDLIGPAELFAATDEQEFVDYLISRAEGSAYPAVRGEVFEDAQIARLSPSASAEFEVQLWPLWRMVGALQEENRSLRRARDELLPLLMSGKVRVGLSDEGLDELDHRNTLGQRDEGAA